MSSNVEVFAAGELFHQSCYNRIKSKNTTKIEIIDDEISAISAKK